MERNSSPPLELFYCYAREDRALRDELDRHLAGLRRSGLITAWYDGEIVPGTPWEQEIETRLEGARVILLLVSSDFIHSDYCYSKEMARAIERHHRKEARVIPILLRPADWTDTPFSKLQMLPSHALPVTRWPDRDAAFEDVARGIRRAANDLRSQQAPDIPSSMQEVSFTTTKILDKESTTSPLVTRKLYETTTSSFLPPAKGARGKLDYRLLSILLAIVLVLATVILAFLWYSASSTTLGTGVINKPNNEQIGISDGTYALDVGADRVDRSLKIEASQKFAQGDKPGAMSLWMQAVGKTGIDTSDAEALIYLENQRVLDSASPYITLVVGTRMKGDDNAINAAREDLQGAYVKQKESNDGRKLSGGKLVRLLIANAGSKPDYVTGVAEQIVQAAKHDPTIVGVMGWSRSTYAEKAIPVLAREHIPMVSSTASADSLSGVSPYFFRIAPPNRSQAIAGAKYAQEQLRVSRAALFVDPNESYSRTLAERFKEQFVADGNQIVDTENYTVGDKASLRVLLQKALNSHPDLIYYSGHADDLTVLLANLPTSQPSLQVLGGDALYAPYGYPSTARPGFSRLHFTTFAYPDEWSILGMKESHPFFEEYKAAFNPADADHSAEPYGYTREDDGVILSYDALYALLQGCQNVLDAHSELTPDALQKGLTTITGTKAIQGVSGQISFGSNGDPMNKAVVILYLDSEGRNHMLERNGVYGCFELGKCG